MPASIRSLVVTAPFAFCISLIAAQTNAPAPAPQEPGAFAGESFVIQQAASTYTFKADGTGVRERSATIRIQSEAALRSFGVISVSFAGASEHVEFRYARVRHPGGTVSETALGGVLEQPEQVTREAPFYSDLRQAQLPIQNLRVGDTLEWDARVIRTRAEAPGHFWGTEDFITEGAVARNQSIELHVPSASTVTVWTNPSLAIKPAEEITSTEHIYRWTYDAAKPTFGAAADLEKKAKKSHVLTSAEALDADQGKLSSVAWTNFTSWPEVGAWYRSLEGQRARPDDEIRAKAAEVTTGKTTAEEKVRALYGYVSANIRYIGVAFGVGRYQPHEAADVLHNQYGDCKDKALLLTAMLDAVGISSDSALVGANIRFNDALPSPAAFNHLITHLTLGSDEVWLDSTAEVAPYRLLYSVIRDRKALVIPPTGAAHLELTPKLPPFAPFTRWEAKGTLAAEGIADSHIVVAMRGDDELILRAALRQVPAAQYSEAAQGIFKSFGYVGTTSHAEFSRPEDTIAPFSFNVDYHRDYAADFVDHRIIPQFAPIYLPSVDEKEPPVAALNLGVPRTETSTAELKLPAGWTAELPEAIHEKSVFGSLDTTYRLSDGTLYSERKLTIASASVPVADWRAYKKWTDAASIGSDFYIVLHAPGGVSSARSGKPASAASSAEVAKLYPQLESAYQRLDVKELDSLLKHMKSLDPNARRYHAWLATTAFLRGKLNEAFEEDRKEIELYPDETDRYNHLVLVRRMQHDKPGVEAVLREWVKAAPKDPDPLFQLSRISIDDDHAEAGLEFAQAASALTTDGTVQRESAQVLAAEAHFKAGHSDQATAILLPLLTASENPNTLNNAAYFLADANLDLPEAEAAERKAIAKLTAETESWTLDESAGTLLSQTSLLAASWDSLGWMLFREGKPAEAVPLIRAARLNHPDATVEKHTRELWITLGTDSPGKFLHDPDAQKSSQQLRTIDLGVSPLKGTASFKLLIADGRIDRFEANGDARLEAAGTLLRAAKPNGFVPPGSTARVYRVGIVNCVNDHCNLILQP